MRVPAMRAHWVTSREHFEHPDVVREYGSFDFLLAPECAIFEELRPMLPAARLLDLGVGGGRTTMHLAHQVSSYIGVDYSAAMIDTCEQRFRGRLGPRLRFECGDVRDLGEFADGSFDVVLFAFNGIDSIEDHDQRMHALREIGRVSAPGSVFVFSTDNLLYTRNTLSLRRALAPFAVWDLVSSPRLVARVIARTLRLRRLNSPVRALRNEHAIYTYLRPRHELSAGSLAGPEEVIQIEGYTIEPRAQIAQLADAGFDCVRMYAIDGREVTEESDDELSRWQWLYYLSQKLALPEDA